MKKNVFYLIVFGGLFFLAGFLLGTNLASQPQDSWLGRRGFVEQRKGADFRRLGSRDFRKKARKGFSQIFVDKLDLDSSQEEEISRIIEKTHQEIKEMAGNFRGNVSEIREKSTQEIMDILDDSQKEEFQRLQEALRKRRRKWKK